LKLIFEILYSILSIYSIVQLFMCNYVHYRICCIVLLCNHVLSIALVHEWI